MKAVAILLLLGLAAIFSAQAEVLVANEQQTFDLSGFDQKLFFLKERTHAAGVVRVEFSSGIDVYGSYGGIPSTASGKLTSPAYLRASMASSDSVEWYFIATASLKGNSITGATIKVDSVPTVELTSGTLGSATLPSNGALQVFHLPATANTGGVIHLVASNGPAVEITAAPGMIPPPTATYSADSYVTALSDNVDWWIVVKAITQTGTNVQVTATNIDTVTLTSGTAASVDLPKNSKRALRLPAAPNTNGVVHVTLTGNTVTLEGAESGRAPSAVTGTDAWLGSESVDGLAWWFILSNTDADVATTASVTVTASPTITLTSGVLASYTFGAAGELKFYKLAAAQNSNGGVLPVFDVTKGTLKARSAPAAQATVVTSESYYFATTDNVAWYFTATGVDAVAFDLTVTAATTTALTAGDNAYTLTADQAKVFKLAGTAGSTGLLRVTATGTGASVTMSYTFISQAFALPEDTPTWMPAQGAASDNVDWWFVASSSNAAVNGLIKVEKIATKALASGTVATVTLAPNELQLYSIPAKENAGGAVKVATSDAANTTEIYVANTIPTPTTTKPYYLSSSTDGVSWFFLFTGGAAGSSVKVNATLVPSILLNDENVKVFSLEADDVAILRFDGVEESTGVVSFVSTPGFYGRSPLFTLSYGVVSRPGASTFNSSGNYASATGSQAKNTWYVVATPDGQATKDSSFKFLPTFERIFCDAAIDCDGRGTCSADGRQCACDAGSTGRYCECNPATTCSGHGMCTPDGDCLCDAYWVGEDCNTAGAWSIVPSFYAVFAALAFAIASKM